LTVSFISVEQETMLFYVPWSGYAKLIFHDKVLFGMKGDSITLFVNDRY